MPGITLTAKNASFQSNSVGYVPPVPRGLVGMYFFGSNAKNKNYAPGGPAASVIGIPAAQTSYSSRLGPAGYIDTGIAETTDLTIFAVARRYSNAQRQVIAGNWRSRDVTNTFDAQGCGLVCEAAGTVTGVAASYTGVAGSASNANTANTPSDGGVTSDINTAPWRALMLKIDTTGTGLRTALDKTAGTGVSAAMVGGNVRDLRNPTSLRVGNGGVLVQSATVQCELMMVAIANVAWTADEEAAFYAYAKAYASRRGITI